MVVALITEKLAPTPLNCTTVAPEKKLPERVTWLPGPPTLGEKVVLPPFLERQRDQIVRNLKPID